MTFCNSTHQINCSKAKTNESRQKWECCEDGENIPELKQLAKSIFHNVSFLLNVYRQFRLKYHDLCVLHQVVEINAEYIYMYQIFPPHLLWWNIDGSKKNPLASLFASFNLSKCTFSGLLKYLCNTAVSTGFLH